MTPRHALICAAALLALGGTGCAPQKVETAAPSSQAADARPALKVDVLSTPGDAAISMKGLPIGKTPQSISVNAASELVHLKAERGSEEAQEKRIRFLSADQAKVHFLFGGERSSMAKALGLAKILVLEFGESITFDVDRHDLKPAFASLLDKQAEMLTVHFKDVDVYVCGHTDGVGNREHNLNLSLARAQAVAKRLASKGVPRSRMKVQGFGSAFPIASNDTPEGRAQNRRTEVVLPQ